MVDSNNNSVTGKYSLRPRSSGCKISSLEFCEEDEATKKTRRMYSQRGQPLSKYRRRSANARERSRMKEINEAFQTLRRVVSRGREEQGEKATKISTLRLAMSYITTLSEALRGTGTEAGDGLWGRYIEEYSNDNKCSGVAESDRTYLGSVKPSSAFSDFAGNKTSSAVNQASAMSMVESTEMQIDKSSFNGESSEGTVYLRKQLKYIKETSSSLTSFNLPGIPKPLTLSTVRGRINRFSNNVNDLPMDIHHTFVPRSKDTTDSSNSSTVDHFNSPTPGEYLSAFCDNNDSLSFVTAPIEEVSSLKPCFNSKYEDSSPFPPTDDEVIPINQISFEDFLDS